MSIIKIRLNEKGISLVETLLAMAIAIMVITSLVSLAVFTLRSSQQSKYLLEGSKLANEELELVRAYRESVPWSTFYARMVSCNTFCFVQVNSTNPVFTVIGGAENMGVPAVSLFRTFTATRPDGTALPASPAESVVRVSVRVSWLIGGSIKTAHTYTDITNWQGN